ncbi:MAG: hydroxyethylthiazole kinase [Thermodesulfobacteriota bacterium]|nr:hydroxyethylthiazole kinase [Thermodesulfobacteriota bacterium]
MNKHEFAQKTMAILCSLREQRPLIHHITNFVVMNMTANVTLAVGASPVMAHAHEEVENMAAFAGALNLNIGTLTPYWIDAMIRAGKTAGRRRIPIVLDPVGSGATALRTDAAKKILAEVPVSVIRGNASEVMSLFADKDAVNIRGVDSLETVDAVRHGAQMLAGELKKVIAVTGPVDIVTDGTRTLEVHNGTPMFSRVTGTGCSATTVISCFCAVEPDLLVASAAALGYYGLAGEEAARISNGPGSFQAALLDALYRLPEETIREKLRVRAV